MSENSIVIIYMSKRKYVNSYDVMCTWIYSRTLELWIFLSRYNFAWKIDVDGGNKFSITK